MALCSCRGCVHGPEAGDETWLFAFAKGSSSVWQIASRLDDAGARCVLLQPRELLRPSTSYRHTKPIAGVGFLRVTDLATSAEKAPHHSDTQPGTATANCKERSKTVLIATQFDAKNHLLNPVKGIRHRVRLQPGRKVQLFLSAK